jgi:hypothetical protein
MDTESQRDSGLGVAERHPSVAIGAHAQVWTAASDLGVKVPLAPYLGVTETAFVARLPRG